MSTHHVVGDGLEVNGSSSTSGNSGDGLHASAQQAVYAGQVEMRDSNRSAVSSTSNHHVVWGGLEVNGTSSTSGSSGDGLRASAQQAVDAGQVEMRDSNSSSNSDSPAPEAAGTSRTSTEIVGGAPAASSSSPLGASPSSPHPTRQVRREVSGQILTSEDRDLVKRALLDADVWSQGSSKHYAGTCVPCRNSHGKQGCSNGADCRRCHLPHTDATTAKIGMWKRRHCKCIARALLVAIPEDEPERSERITSAVGRDSRLFQRLMAKRSVDLPGDNEDGDEEAGSS